MVTPKSNITVIRKVNAEEFGSRIHATGAENDKQSALVYWIYLLPSTQQTVSCNGFYNDMFRLARGIVRLRSEPFGFSSIITYSSGGCWSV
jgi:hypothetical protein